MKEQLKERKYLARIPNQHFQFSNNIKYRVQENLHFQLLVKYNLGIELILFNLVHSKYYD